MEINNTEVPNVKLSTELRELLWNEGIFKPSKYFYEWTGATEIEETNDGRAYFFIDNINAYTVRQIKNILPKNVEVNENVKEIGYRSDDCEADKWARLAIYLLKNRMIKFHPPRKEQE